MSREQTRYRLQRNDHVVADRVSRIAVPNRADRSLVGDLLESGDIAPVIDRRHSLEEVPEAIASIEAGPATDERPRLSSLSGSLGVFDAVHNEYSEETCEFSDCRNRINVLVSGELLTHTTSFTPIGLDTPFEAALYCL